MIKMSNLNKAYSAGKSVVPILSNIDLQILAGEFVSIMGPSGSGKTTLMNILGLLDRPSSGSYFFENEDVLSFDAEKLARFRNFKIGFVFQSFMLMPKMNLIENVSLPLIYQNITTHLMAERSKELLNRVGLWNLEKRKPPELSGGQQQRVAIARALITKPKLILADEPTGALDTQTGQEIFSLLKELNEIDKTTIIIVTHDPKIANQCQRIIKIQDGNIIQ